MQVGAAWELVMTDTALDTILARLDKLEKDVGSRFAKLESDVSARFAKLDINLNACFARVEAKLDEKPGYGALYQISFGTVFALIAFAAAMTGLYKASGIIP